MRRAHTTELTNERNDTPDELRDLAPEAEQTTPEAAPEAAAQPACWYCGSTAIDQNGRCIPCTLDE